MTAGSIALLMLGADRLVSAAARLARALGVSTVIIGATIVSLGTTSPEAAVSVKAAWAGNPGLALGNGIGSMICNIALIFGLCCCIRPLPLDRFVLNRHGSVQLGGGILLGGLIVISWLIVGRDLSGVVLGRGAGVILLVLLIGYLLMSVRWARTHPELAVSRARSRMKLNHSPWHALGTAAVLLLSLALVVGGAEVLVGSAREICLRYKVPEAVLAGTLVAFGTSVPELVTAIASIIKGHTSLLMGNVVGANALNVLFVIGASAVARPLQVGKPTFYLFLPVMLVVLVVFRLYIVINRDRFRRWQGIPLLAIYIAFVIIAVGYFGVGAG